MAKALEGNNPRLSHSYHSEHHGAHKGRKRKHIKEQRPERATYPGSKNYMGRTILSIIVYSVSLRAHRVVRFGKDFGWLAIFCGIPFEYWLWATGCAGLTLIRLLMGDAVYFEPARRSATMSAAKS
jgi:hypothetical protein